MPKYCGGFLIMPRPSWQPLFCKLSEIASIYVDKFSIRKNNINVHFFSAKSNQMETRFKVEMYTRKGEKHVYI